MKYLIENLSDLNKIEIKNIDELSSSYIAYFNDSVLKTKKEKKSVKDSFLIDEITKFDASINRLRTAGNLGELEAVANSLLDNYNRVYSSLADKYKKYGKDIFEPITNRWRIINKNTTYLKYGFGSQQSMIFTNKKNVPNDKINIKKVNHRKEIIKKLIDDKATCKCVLKEVNCKEMFKLFENGLEKEGYINDTWTKWESSAPSLVRFYFFCIDKNHTVFRDKYTTEENFTNGLKLLRKLYDYWEKPYLNERRKMKIANNAKNTDDDFDVLLRYL